MHYYRNQCNLSLYQAFLHQNSNIKPDIMQCTQEQCTYFTHKSQDQRDCRRNFPLRAGKVPYTRQIGQTEFLNQEDNNFCKDKISCTRELSHLGERPKSWKWKPDCLVYKLNYCWQWATGKNYQICQKLKKPAFKSRSAVFLETICN